MALSSAKNDLWHFESNCHRSKSLGLLVVKQPFGHAKDEEERIAAKHLRYAKKLHQYSRDYTQDPANRAPRLLRERSRHTKKAKVAVDD